MPSSIIPAPLRPAVIALDRLGRTRVLAGMAALCGGLFLLSLALPLPPTAADSAVVSQRVTDRDGQLLREVRPDGRGRPVSLADVDPAVVDALLATEDRRFWQHPGVDPLAIGRAAWSNWTHGTVVSGASTLTMQVARLLRSAPDRGLVDKMLEMHLALRLELRWSKTRILETWLNRVAFGNRAHGIEAAAQLYFGKAAVDLRRAEAAFLVGLPQSPSRYNPFRHPDQARARQQRVLRAMERVGHLTPAQRRHLETLPLDLLPRMTAFRAPHFTEWVARTEGPDAAFASEAGPSRPPVNEVRTTLDGALQQRVEGLVQGHVKLLTGEGVTNAAAVVLDNRTGAVRAYVGSADFWNDAIEGQNDGVQMLRQPGSTLKPFTYGHALQSRAYTTASVLPDVQMPVPEGGGAFVPSNYDDRFHGPTPLRTALASSYNVPAVLLAREMGAPRLLDALHAAGFTTLDRPARHYGVGLTLGNGEVRLLDLARAYAGLARGGTLPAVRAVQWRRAATGDTLHAPRTPAQSMGLTPAVTHLLRDVLADPAARAPAFGRGGPLELPFPAVAKTGTSKDYRDNWTVGFTPAHTVAVWVGNFDGSPMRRVSGVTGAAPLFRAILEEVGPSGAFPTPPGLETAAVCPASGNRPGAFCPAPRPESFLTGTVPTDTCRVHRRVAVDTRSGRRATASTPAPFVQTALFAAYPPIYHPWMREHGIPFPPPAAGDTSGSGEAASSTALAGRSGREETTDAPLLIQYPADGAQFVTDPVLRPAYQRLHLRGAAPEGWQDVHWTVNGQRLDGPFDRATWPLQAGRHVVELRARTPDDTPARSRPAVIEVHAPPRTAAWPSRDAIPLRTGDQ